MFYVFLFIRTRYLLITDQMTRWWGQSGSRMDHSGACLPQVLPKPPSRPMKLRQRLNITRSLAIEDKNTQMNTIWLELTLQHSAFTQVLLWSVALCTSQRKSTWDTYLVLVEKTDHFQVKEYIAPRGRWSSWSVFNIMEFKSKFVSLLLVLW